MELYKVIKEEFKDIAKKYTLAIKELSDNETVVYSNDYIVSFEMHSSELDLSYIERTEEGRQLQYYNFGSFIAYLTEPDTRNEVNMMELSSLEKQIKIYQTTLKNKFVDLLENNKLWMEEYKKFILYAPPRDITEIKKIYEKLNV